MFEHLKLLGASDFRNSQEKFGVYVLKSRDSDVFYRVGACGVKDQGTISRRFRTHRGVRPKENSLWTNRNKPWDPIWCASIIDGDPSMAGAAERFLYIAMARKFRIIDTSGFEAPPHDQQSVIAVASEAAKDINHFIGHYRATIAQRSDAAGSEWYAQMAVEDAAVMS